MSKKILNIVRQSRAFRLPGHHNATPNRSLIFAGAAGLLVATMGAVGFASRNDSTNADMELNDTTSSVPLIDTQPSTLPSQGDTSTPVLSTTDSRSSSASSHTSITVNNQPVEVPENGSSQQTIINEDGSHVDISIDNQSVTSGSNNSNTTTHLNINSFSANSSVQQQNKTGTFSD